ncbi:MAG: hypothetical protein NVS9B15_15030 [Acidobacteriaceae bacterium]
MAGDSSAIRQIDAPCQLITDRAIQYLEAHGFNASRKTGSDLILIDASMRKDASLPSGKPLSLSRSSIHKYTIRHLSPLKTYDNFQLEGHLRLAKAAEQSCDVTVRFDISAYEWVWALAVIDDGYRSKFNSNGTLERLYMDPICEPFTKGKR